MNLSVKNDYEEIRFGWTPLPVMGWRHTDKQGHLHKFEGDEMSPRLPSLEWVVDVPEDDEYPEQGHYECALCREVVVPLRQIDPDRVFHVLVRTHFYKDSEEITRNEFDKLYR